MATLAEKLKKSRERKKFSMAQVARLSAVGRFLGEDHRAVITQGYISRLEAGREQNPSYFKIKTLCDIYKIKPGSLF